MSKFGEFVIRFRLWIIISTVILTLIFGYGLTFSTINSDLLSYLDPEDPAIKLFHRLGDEYGGNTIALVALEDENIFTYKTLSRIRDLTESYRQLPGVSSVLSLTNIVDIKKIEGGIEVSKLIDRHNIPQDLLVLDSLRTYTLNKDLYRDKIVSHDGKIALIIIRLLPDVDKNLLGKKIKQMTEELKGDYQVYYGGVPLQMIELNDLLINDLTTLVPIVVLLVIFMLFVSFRSLRGIILPLTTVLIASVWSLGLMGWLGKPLSIISNTMPVTLIAIGTAYGIHLLAKYYEEVNNGTDSSLIIVNVLKKVGLPILLTGVTTLVGFLSFTGAFLTAVTDFGIFSAIGVGIAMIIAVTFLPAILSYLPVKGNKVRNKEINRILPYLFRQLKIHIIRDKKLILFGSLLVIIAASFWIPGIRTDVSMINVFPPNSEVVQTDNLLREKFGGALGVQIVFQGDLKNPAVLAEMLEMGRALETLPTLSNAQSLADLICNMNDVMNGKYMVPSSSIQVANLLFMLEGEELLSQLVNNDYTEGILQLNFSYSTTEDFLYTYQQINDYIQQQIDSIFIEVDSSRISGEEPLKVTTWKVERALQDIRYYLWKRLGVNATDLKNYKELLIQLSQSREIPFEPGVQQLYQKRLRDFFLEEADIYLETEQEIATVTQAIINEVKTGSINRNRLKTILQNNIPPGYYQTDPELLDETLESLLDVLQNLQYENKLIWMKRHLLQQMPNSWRQDQKFEHDLESILWKLIIPARFLPASIAGDIQGETIKLRVKQSGVPVVLTRFHHNLIQSQLNSLLIAFGVVLILMMILFRSLLLGLIVTTPIVYTVVLNFGIMSILHTPLDLATMMIASVAIGIGIDYAIHFSSRYRMELFEVRDEKRALENTLNSTGKALLINAITVGLGFIILVWSNIIPVQRFGWLIALTMLISVIAALTILPALFLFTGYFQKKINGG